MAKLMKWAFFFLLCFAMQGVEAQNEARWADIELDAGILGFGTHLGNASSEDAIYQPGTFGTVVNFQLSRVKTGKWGMWLGVVGSSSSNTTSLENFWLSEIEAIHPNAFISSTNTNAVTFSRTHYLAGVLKRKQIGSFNLNYGAGLGAARLSGIGNIEIQTKDLGSNHRTTYTYDYGVYDAWTWSANVYADLDVKLYRSGELQWMAFFRTSAIMHGQNGEMNASVTPILGELRRDAFTDSGTSFHLDMNLGIRLRLVNMEKWKMFRFAHKHEPAQP
ncbi:MAG: hypothetical protein P8N19_03760 [Flavobacteriales bacterium]|nr:hypothetical protein [Flavobacteriales bacterium]MDG1765863.1 hypothetical protein [Flavobacteriales bacterium]